MNHSRTDTTVVRELAAVAKYTLAGFVIGGVIGLALRWLV